MEYDFSQLIDIEIKLLIEAIFLRYNHDFRGYSAASVKRRVGQALFAMQCDSVSNLQSRILADPEAFTKLLQYLTVPTSEMFRDPEYYLKLRAEVLPVLKTYPSLKIWIAGCSTGEEVYSFAILLSEEGLLDRTIIYATDINPVSLARAQQGIFNTENIKLFSANYQKAGGTKSLGDYYHAKYDVAKFDRGLAENVVFRRPQLGDRQRFFGDPPGLLPQCFDLFQ